jgi:glyoxylase-like metal-dependent hydrolase (beta-lactamase superfamily II)
VTVHELNRRTFVLSGTAAVGALGLAGPVEIMSSAHAQTATSPLNPTGEKFHRFKVGDIEVTTVFDGAVARDHNPGFVKNASVDDVKAALKAANLPEDKVPNSYTVTVVKIGDQTVMFDAGNPRGGSPDSGHLTDNLKAAGIDAGKLSAIVITHFHPDHIYGLMTKDNAQVFGETPIVVPEAEYKFWSDPAVIEKLAEGRRGIAQRVQATMPNWKNLQQVADDKDAVAGVRAVASPGHSPGHTSYLVSAGNAQVMVLGDITNIPAFNMRNPGWHISFDQDAEMAEATRRRIFDRVVADKIVCTGYHWGMPGAGTVEKDGGGYVLKPVA